MKQLMLFGQVADVIETKFEEKIMTTMTWSDLFGFLSEQFSGYNINGSDHVMVYDYNTGEQYYCDTLEIDGKLVIAFNKNEDEDV